MNSPIGSGQNHPRSNQLLNTQHDSILAFDADDRAAVVNGLGGVLDLENSAVRRERRHREIVASAYAAHLFSSLCSTTGVVLLDLGAARGSEQSKYTADEDGESFL